VTSSADDVIAVTSSSVESRDGVMQSYGPVVGCGEGGGCNAGASQMSSSSCVVDYYYSTCTAGVGSVSEMLRAAHCDDGSFTSSSSSLTASASLIPAASPTHGNNCTNNTPPLEPNFHFRLLAHN